MKCLFATLALTAVAAAGTIDDGTPDSRYIAYGRAFRHYTARFSGVNADGRQHIATAVLIAPRWALTAAHVADGCSAVQLDYGDDQAAAITRVITHPEWNDAIGWHDLALLEAEGDFGAEWYPPLFTGDERGRVASVCGYGVTGRMSGGYSTSDGLLRAGCVVLDRFEKACAIADIGARSPLPFGIAPGDSGGPVFIDGALAAISSYTSSRTKVVRSRRGEESGHVRISLYRDWIRSVMEGHDGAHVSK